MPLPIVKRNHAKAPILQTFIGFQQLSLLADLLADDENEEQDHFWTIRAEVIKTVQDMPKTYETEEVEDPQVHLHYFFGGWDWYIIEKDMYKEQNQAYGFVKSPMSPKGEFGYISIPEVLSVGAELDYYFTKAPVSSFK